MPSTRVYHNTIREDLTAKFERYGIPVPELPEKLTWGTPITWLCACEKATPITRAWEKMYRERDYLHCEECRRVHQGKVHSEAAREQAIARVRKFAAEKGFTFNEADYVNTTTPIPIIAACGHPTTATPNALGNHYPGRTCVPCGRGRTAELQRARGQKTIDRFRPQLAKWGVGFDATIFPGTREPWPVKCRCGTEVGIKLGSMKTTQFIGCAACRNKFAYPTGPKSHLWNPELTDADRETNAARRKTTEYREWQKWNFNRTDRTCELSGVRRDLHAHHVRDWSSCIELRFDRDNCCVMHETLHGLFHRLYGYGDNDPSQLREFAARLGVPPPRAVRDEPPVKVDPDLADWVIFVGGDDPLGRSVRVPGILARAA